MKNNESDYAALLEALALAAQPPEDEVELDLPALFHHLRCRIWVILACFVAGAFAAFGATYLFVKPQYKATGELYLVSASNAASVELSDLQLGSSLVSDYQELLLSRLLLEDVVRNLSLEMNTDTLASMLSVENPAGSHVLKISATGTNPQQAADIANEMLRQAVIYLPRIMEIPVPNVIHDAAVPRKKASPSYSWNTAAGAALAALACCFVLAVRFMTDGRVTTPEDAARYFGRRPLAVLPAEAAPKRGGPQPENAPGRKRERKRAAGQAVQAVCTLPELSAEGEKALDRLRVSLRLCGEEMRVVLVTSSAPGEGKSFVAAHLWRSMARAGRRTLLIDCDLRGEGTPAKYGLEGPGGAAGLAHCLAGRAKPEEAICKTDLLNGWLLPSAAPAANPAQLLEGPRLAELLAFCRQNFDFVVVDAPPLDGAADALRAAGCCDGALLVIHSGRTQHPLVEESVEMLERTGRPLLGFVLNRADVRRRA